jgi:hypothetical protein
MARNVGGGVAHQAPVGGSRAPWTAHACKAEVHREFGRWPITQSLHPRHTSGSPLRVKRCRSRSKMHTH